MTSSCAICTDEVGPFDIGELDGRVYIMCQKCLSEHPRDNKRKPVERGYNPSPSIGGMQRRAAASNREQHGGTAWRDGQRTAIVTPKTTALAKAYRAVALPDAGISNSSLAPEARFPDADDQREAVAPLIGEPLIGAGRRDGSA